MDSCEIEFMTDAIDRHFDGPYTVCYDNPEEDILIPGADVVTSDWDIIVIDDPDRLESILSTIPYYCDSYMDTTKSCVVVVNAYGQNMSDVFQKHAWNYRHLTYCSTNSDGVGIIMVGGEHVN